ncbi:PTS transporter subunit EIIC [Streptococcus oralis]|uniref:PTS system, glucose-specific IIB or IIC component n=1 Tax=Streptococcus oralis TaxID=1303 RepID=A0A139P8Q9_STROR|nr:PTS transporter subunit EIIC [Streptococcus oralis]KXT84750.1 PTS system, glucose-specific IIB or IIC component [Streptococcus oralis]
MASKNKVILAFEEFGRVLLLPVSILPGAGIIKGIGAAFTNGTTLKMYPFLQNEAFQFLMNLFVALGDVVFSHLHVIFAVGVAVGLAKKEKGSAALSGLVGFIVLHKVLNFLLTQTGTLVTQGDLAPQAYRLAMAAQMQTSVLGIQTMDLNVFGGIITGLVVYYVHKKVLNIKVPQVLSFFSGPRLVPLVVIPVMALVASGLFLVWPFVQQGITAFSGLVVKTGYIGTFLYAILERSLLPFGLHHGLNLPVMTTDLGGVWTIAGEKVGGTLNAYMASLTDSSILNIDPTITRFNAGKFVYFMFGLPAAALAMYRTAKPENKKTVASLLTAAAATSFITGITEPLEFTFLFVAPMLYGVHALLAGLTSVVTELLGGAVMAPMGHGLINFLIYGLIQGGKTHWYVILLVGLGCAFLYYHVFKFMILKFDLKTPGRGDSSEVKLSNRKEVEAKYQHHDETVVNAQESDLRKQARALIAAHGGYDNIENVDACITRLRINVKDRAQVDQDLIVNHLEALGFVESGMQMQSIYGGKANILKNEILDIFKEEGRAHD